MSGSPFRPDVAPAALDGWCRRWLRSPSKSLLFEAGYLSAVTGLRLEDGREVVVKVRPAARRLHGCHAGQVALWRAGFPCPEPLVGPRPLGDWAAGAETLVEDIGQLEPQADSPRLFAEALAELVARAPAPTDVPSLAPSLPWVGWDHQEPGVWPAPDDRDADLNAHGGATWLDAVADAARRRLQADRAAPVVGHGDWHSANLRWQDRRLHAVHDWDSLICQPQAAVAGFAAAVFPGTGGPCLDRGRGGGVLGGRTVGPVVRRQERVPGWNPDLILTRAEARERLRRAGLPTDLA